MAVPPTLHVIFILTATLLFLLVAVAIGLEYNAAHSSVARWLSRLAVVAVGGCSRRSQSASECKRVGVSLQSESVCRVAIEQSLSRVVSS